MQVHIPLHEKPICRCETCGKIFRSKKSLSGHRVVHSKRSPFLCDICERGFVSRRNLRNHQKGHLSGSNYRCDVCDVYFRSSANLAVHRAKSHFDPKYTSFPKVISEMAFKIENSLNSVEKIVYPCEQCERSFTNKVLWVDHMQKHFSDQHRCICFICGHSNASLEDLKSHLEAHSSDVPPPPSISPPKTTLSNYDAKYFISFFASNGIELRPTVKMPVKAFEQIPPPPPVENVAMLKKRV
ncbi:hypothetical protein MHBO_002993 [Bonamia ostreae]|uniref:C2H2-type domain-containing protein n=1 Tax=Bonamia ostreae TaxID=126728 RepID=A0ABV2APK5_9EUKA